MANNGRQKSVFYAVLNMGLGHATRSLPVIREFGRRGWRVVVGSSGRALVFLRQELPGAEFIELPDYRLEYSGRGVRLLPLLARVPRLFRLFALEQKITEEAAARAGAGLVVSDHRYGCYSRTVPSVFISHQLRFIAPPFLRLFEFAGVLFNRSYHRRYSAVLVPDEFRSGEGLYSGRLTDVKRSGAYHFPGILSSVRKLPDLPPDIDLFIAISGPEPQRTRLEEIVRKQLPGLEGRIVVALGQPESTGSEQPAENIRIFHHPDRQSMEQYLNRSRLVVSRSGYSTVMELAALGKKALFIPTPGQTEQMYLAEHFEARGWCHSVSQEELSLRTDTKLAREYDGFPRATAADKTVDNIFRIISRLPER